MFWDETLQEYMMLIANNMDKVSQSKAILRALQNGEILSSLSMLERFGAIDGRKRISELRAAGNIINDEYRLTPEGKRHKIYFMTDPI